MSVEGRDLVLGFVLDGLDGDLLLALLMRRSVLDGAVLGIGVVSILPSVAQCQSFWWLVFAVVFEKVKSLYCV